MDILVVKKKGEKIEAKIRSKDVGGGYAPVKYRKEINFKDYRDWALFFSDMAVMFGAPITKAIALFKETEGEPFW